KAKQNLEFIQERFLEAQSKFYDTQKSLSNFRDRNQNLNFSSARAQEERLLAEYNLASNLYNNLAIQLDQAKIKVQEDIPQLTIINPPVVSYQVSKP
ncbi:MAG TPA: exopolysaccharide biosynthesis protein, partial [Algoriphagus sp.]|nr:exopolysaccharide biosynthesis protein [Algoriphagus sp.]